MEEPQMRVRTSFTPLRMVAGRKETVILAVEVKNRSNTAKNYSVSVKLPFVLNFVGENLLKEKRVRLGGIEPNQSKDAIFKIYGKYNIQPGSYNIEITVREHEVRFDKATGQVKTTATLRVV
ncbi:MAG: hypothetical protein J7K68_04720 [Candidatus Diapherotrites archaeon]|nr:hypothetical protein [Candidatus Diapherotrites archaeon]